MNLKLWAVIVGVILVFNLAQFLSSKEVGAKLDQDSKNLSAFENSLENEKLKIDAKKAQMDKMSDRRYNENVDSYNALVEKYKSNISKYNTKVNEYNKRAKNSTVTYLIPGLPRR